MTPSPTTDTVVVVGLWHLGSVTAACLAQHHDVIGVDLEPAVVEGLSRGRAPIFEPGLDELIQAGLRAGRLRFESDPGAVVDDPSALWICYDTPVDDEDESDVARVLDQAERVLARLAAGTLVIVSAQLPVGTVRALEAAHPTLAFACVPENLRLGQAIEAFDHPDRVVVGVRTDDVLERVRRLLSPLGAELIVMRPESAEMVKHSLNAFSPCRSGSSTRSAVCVNT